MDEGESHANSLADAPDFDAMSEGDSSEEEYDIMDEGDDAMSTITVEEEDEYDMSEGSIDRDMVELNPTHLPIMMTMTMISTNCPSPGASLLPTTTYIEGRQCFSHLTSNTEATMLDCCSFLLKHFASYQTPMMPHPTLPSVRTVPSTNTSTLDLMHYGMMLLILIHMATIRTTRP
jgi:hypothetical protein